MMFSSLLLLPTRQQLLLRLFVCPSANLIKSIRSGYTVCVAISLWYKAQLHQVSSWPDLGIIGLQNNYNQNNQI